jgi:peptidylprolyl isomerase
MRNSAFKAGAGALAAAAVGISLAACGSSNSSSSASVAKGVITAPGQGATVEAVTTTAAATTATSTTAAATITTPSSGPLSTQPTIAKPSGAAPKKLVTKDLITGTGATAKAGDEITVNYVGELYSNGKIFDSSWSRKMTFGPFQLGAGAVIKGWDQGLVGMKVGGRRELIIPPSLGYGAAGSGSTIPKNATLIFDVDLLGVSQ